MFWLGKFWCVSKCCCAGEMVRLRAESEGRDVEGEGWEGERTTWHGMVGQEMYTCREDIKGK